jgi:putative transposase
VAVVCCVELNPVRAGLVRRPQNWPWSSARAHLTGRDDGLVTAATALLEEVGDWRAFLASGLDDTTLDTIRCHERTGRPLEGDAFVTALEEQLGRRLRSARRARKPSRERVEDTGAAKG